MKNLTYAQFMNEVENIISNLSKDELKNKIMDLAESQDISDRNNFLQLLKQGISPLVYSDKEKATSEISPKKLIERIEKFNQRILNGEFFDEEENMVAYHREEHRYGRNRYNDYYEDEIDFSNELYVLEAIELLEEAKMFFRRNDIETAYKAYGMLFDIFENPDYYDSGEEYFIYGFSFQDAIDSEVYKEHKTIYLRGLYLELIKENNLKAIYNFLTNESEILLSDIMEIARVPLPKLDEVIRGLIDYLKDSPAYDKLLIDVLFIKGGMEEIKKFAYTNGTKHPPVFLYYYQCAKEQGFSESDLLRLIIDGIKIIPVKYQSRSFLSLDLIEIAKKQNDKENLILGYSTGFYSTPTLRNLTYFLDFIISEKNEKEANKLKRYLSQRDIKKSNSGNFSHYRNHTLSEDIYSLDSLKIDCKTLIIGRYIFEGIEPFLDFINPKDYLGFSGPLRYIAIIISLVLKSISQSHDAYVIDRLIEHYCLDETREERIILKKLISNKANSLVNPQNYLLKLLGKVEKLSVKRVSHVLENKLRGGYESACLLLVACAEAKQILTRDGDRFIHQIDTQYKRFSAFRKSLKDLTSMSKYLISFS